MKPRLKGEWLPRAYSNQSNIRRPKAKLNHVILCKTCTCITSANLHWLKQVIWLSSTTMECENILYPLYHTACNKWRIENTSYYSVQRAHQYDPKGQKHSSTQNTFWWGIIVRKAEMNEFNNGKLLLKSQSSSKFHAWVRRLCSTDI